MATIDKGSLPSGVGIRWKPGHPTENDLQQLLSSEYGMFETMDSLRERFQAPDGYATLGDYQATLSDPTRPRVV